MAEAPVALSPRRCRQSFPSSSPPGICINGGSEWSLKGRTSLTGRAGLFSASPNRFPVLPLQESCMVQPRQEGGVYCSCGLGCPVAVRASIWAGRLCVSIHLPTRLRMSLDVVVGSWLGSILILNPSAALLRAQPTMAAPLPGGGALFGCEPHHHGGDLSSVRTLGACADRRTSHICAGARRGTV